MEDTKQTAANAAEPTPREKELLGIIKEMSEKLENKVDASLVASEPTVKHKNKTYRVTAPQFSFKGKEYTVLDLKDPKLVAELVERRVGFLEEVEK